MPGQYSTRCRSRPHPESSGSQTAPPRRFLCVRCRTPVLVCSYCDRGQIYCAGGCAQEARACAQRAAGQRYQESFRGRLKHAARSARHWIATSFVGGPVRKCFDLRGEVVRRLTEFGNVGARWKGSRAPPNEIMDRSAKEIARVEDAQRVFRDLASQMRAFAENEFLAMKLVRLWYDPRNASDGLIGFSTELDTYGESRASRRKPIETALRINS